MINDDVERRNDTKILEGLDVIEGQLASHLLVDTDNNDKIYKELIVLETRFSNHLTIYANNGKESKRVADALFILCAQSADRDIKVDEMYKVFTDEAVVAKADARRWNNVIKVGQVITAILVVGGALVTIITLLVK